MIYQGPTYILFISLVYFFAPSGVGSMEVETGFAPQAVALEKMLNSAFLDSHNFQLRPDMICLN